MRKTLFTLGGINAGIIFLIYYANFWYVLGMDYPFVPDFDDITFPFLYIIVLVIICIYNAFSCFKEKKDALRIIIWHVAGPALVLLSLAMDGGLTMQINTFFYVFISFYGLNILIYSLAAIFR